MKLIIAGGGTGGHLFPGIAVAEEFLARDPANEVLFVGTERGIEARAVPAAGYPVGADLSSRDSRQGDSQPAQGCSHDDVWLCPVAKDTEELSPGYGSRRGRLRLPADGAGSPRHADSPLHSRAERHSRQTNRLLARFASKVFITLEESASYFPPTTTLLTGNPLRRQILDMVEKVAPSSAEDDVRSAGNFRLFVFGGSQGAHAINTAMIEALPLLKKSRVTVIITHQTGEKDYAEVTAAYRAAGVDATVTPFISDMAAEYATADLIICRAGATTIAEVTACGKACLFIPFPHAVDDHQRRNAEALLKKDACFMMLERELTGGTLAQSILHTGGRSESGTPHRRIGLQSGPTGCGRDYCR